MKSLRVFDALESWNRFWYEVGQFFMVKDDSGINYLTRILFCVGIIVVSWFLIKLIEIILKRAMGIHKKGPNIDKSARFFIVTVIKVILWILVALLVIAILKIDVTGLAGVASAITVALGLALQDLIGCMFSGMLLIQQKIILNGEYISVSNAYGVSEGVVDKVHLFFTYLNTPQGQQIVIPNNNMTKAAITNYTRLGRRRVDYDVGVAYDSDIALTKKVLSQILEEDDRVLEETYSVYVVKLDSYSVQIRVRCFTKVEDYWPFYNELSEKVLLKFRENDIYIPSSTEIKIDKK